MAKSNIKLAEALLRRKELNAKVETLRHIKSSNLFETRVICYLYRSPYF